MFPTSVSLPSYKQYPLPCENVPFNMNGSLFNANAFGGVILLSLKTKSSFRL